MSDLASSISRVARALSSHTERAVARHGKASYHGKVTQVSPLLVDILGIDDDDPHDDDEITIGDALQTRITARGGLQVGDTLTLVEIEDDDFVAVELLPG